MIPPVIYQQQNYGMEQVGLLQLIFQQQEGMVVAGGTQNSGFAAGGTTTEQRLLQKNGQGPFQLKQ
jgi:hypothetical protein